MDHDGVEVIKCQLWTFFLDLRGVQLPEECILNPQDRFYYNKAHRKWFYTFSVNSDKSHNA